MLEHGKISGYQLMVLVILMILPTAILFLPAISAASAKQDAWISPIIAMVGGLGIATLVLSLGYHFPDKPLDLFCMEIIGTWLGRCIGLLYFWFFLHITSIVAREYGDYLASSVLPNTPLEILIGTTVIASAYAVWCGLENIGRMGECILPIGIGIIVAVLLLTSWEFKYEQLTPVLAEGVAPVLEGAYAPFSWFGEVVTVAFLLPFVRSGKTSTMAVTAGIVIIGVSLVAVAVITIGVFGASEVARMKFPMFELARLINVANILQRVEWLVNSLWIFGAFMKITIYYYVAALIGARWFRLSDYRILIFPLGLMIIIFSLWLYPSIVELSEFLSKVWPSYSLLVFEIGIPLLLFLIHHLRGRRRGTA